MRLSLFIVLASLAVSQMGAQELVLFDNENPPFMYSENNTARGIYPEIIRTAFSRMKLEVTCVSVPWKRALSETGIKPVGIGGLYKNREREAWLDFSAPFYRETIVIYHLSGKAKMSGLKDLYGKKVGVIDGWSYGDEFDSAVRAGNILAEPNQSDALNFKKLIADRIDAVIAVANSGDAIVRQLSMEGTIERSGTIYALNVYLAFNKKAGRTSLLTRFNAAIAGMKADGSFDHIVKTALAAE